MKTTFLRVTSLFLAFLVLSTQSLFAASSKELVVAEEDVNLDIAAFEAEFAELDQIEDFVVAEGVSSLAELEAADLSLDLSKIKNVNSIESTQGFDWDNFDWPSGLWGFLCCPIGFFVVITNKDKTKDQKISFWIGFAAGAVLSAITTPVYYTSY